MASDEPRVNKYSVSKLNMLHSGNRSNIEPIHNDLFLGFTEKDPRGHVTGPDLRKGQEQMWHRKNIYEQTLHSDADASIPSEGVNQKKAMENFREASFKVKEYRKIFETSTDGMHTGYNGMPDSKPIMGKIENTNVIADLNDINNIAKRRDWTTQKSSDTPIGYLGVTDHKFKIAKYGNKGKTSDIKKTNIRKNKDKIERDAKEMIERNGNVITKALKLAMEDIIRDRKKYQDPSLNTQILGSSKNNQNKQTNKNIIIDKTNEAKNILKSHAKAKMMEEISKQFSIGNDYQDIVKNKQSSKNDLIHGKIHQTESYNKTAQNIQDFIFGQIITKVSYNYNKKNDEVNNQQTKTYSNKVINLNENMNKTKHDSKIEKEGFQKRDSDTYKFHKYKSHSVDGYNKVSKDMEGYDSKSVIKKSTDKETQSRKTTSDKRENNNKDYVDIDMEFTQNDSKNRNSGRKIKTNMMKYTSGDNDQDEVSDKERPIYSRK